MKFIRNFLYVLWQWTWGFLQSFGGFCYMLKFRKCRHMWYHGSYVTFFDEWTGGISLGMFIFVAENNEKIQKMCQAKNKVFDEQRQRSIMVHEYGHTIQSLLLGPLYLFVIGLPSITWANSKKQRLMREQTGVKYTSYWCEKWANKCGKAVTKEEPCDD